jgi:hypothetical protein
MFLEFKAFSSMKEERTAQRFTSDGFVNPDKKKGRSNLLRSNPIFMDCGFRLAWSLQPGMERPACRL